MTMLALVKPLPKLAESVAFFRQHGIDTVGLSPINIVPIDSEIAALTQSITRRPATYPSFIVTSTEAAKQLATIYASAGLIGNQVFCIGQSTAALLQPYFTACMHPQQQSSEGLITECLNNVEGPVAIVKGHEGRTAIQQYLQTKHIVFNEFNVYRRVKMQPPFTIYGIDWDRIEMLIATSAMLLECTLDAYTRCALEHKIWIVPSERVKQIGVSLGCKQIIVCDGATNAHLLGCVQKLQRGLT